MAINKLFIYKALTIKYISDIVNRLDFFRTTHCNIMLVFIENIWLLYCHLNIVRYKICRCLLPPATSTTVWMVTSFVLVVVTALFFTYIAVIRAQLLWIFRISRDCTITSFLTFIIVTCNRLLSLYFIYAVHRYIILYLYMHIILKSLLSTSMCRNAFRYLRI